MTKKLVEYSDRLQKTVDVVLSSSNIITHSKRREKGRNTLTDWKGGYEYSAKDEYRKYFKLKIIDHENGTQSISVVNGANETSQYCGYVIAGTKNIAIPKTENLQILYDNTVNYIFVHVHYNIDSMEYISDIMITIGIPPNIDREWSRIIGAVNIVNGKYNVVSQYDGYALEVLDRWVS